MWESICARSFPTGQEQKKIKVMSTGRDDSTLRGCDGTKENKGTKDEIRKRTR